MDTTSPPLTAIAVSNPKVDNLFALQKITPADIQELSTDERRHLGATATTLLARLTGDERTRFMEKIEPILAPDSKNEVWENNHQLITRAVSAYMREHGVMPTKSTIAAQTGLSRQTVAKHLTEYKQHPEFTAQKEQFKFMTHNILANVYKQAGNGDVKAARLYFEMVGALNKQHVGTVVNEQKNYIQINNTILSQENLKQLSAEQLTRIEDIINNR